MDFLQVLGWNPLLVRLASILVSIKGESRRRSAKVLSAGFSLPRPRGIENYGLYLWSRFGLARLLQVAELVSYSALAILLASVICRLSATWRSVSGQQIDRLLKKVTE
jgi:hypothetical protein